MNEDNNAALAGQGAEAPIAPAAPDPNDLSTEMSAEDESAFVDRQLGITDPGAPFALKPDETETPGKKEEAAGQENQKTDKKPEEQEIEQPLAPADDKKVEKGHEEPEEPAAPEAIETSDLFVELEDANGKSFKIGVDDPLPEDFVFKNDVQLAEFAEARLEMKGILRERQSDFEKQTAESEEKNNAEKSEQELYSSWEAEIEDLITAGAIDAPKSKPGDKDYLQDPTIQKIESVFKFMAEQNAERSKTNKPSIRSFGTAYTLWSNDNAKRAEEEAVKKSNQTAKERGALVGGSSSSSAGGGNEGLYVQGSAGSIHDLDFSDI
jgi:hypothetical protein